MKFWEIFWLVCVLFSIVSFFYMSAKVLYYGVFELKYMFRTLDEETPGNNSKEKKIV